MGTDLEQAGPIPMCGREKFGRDILGVRSPRPTTGLPVQGFSARKISPHKLWGLNLWGLQKTSETELVEEITGVPSSFP